MCIFVPFFANFFSAGASLVPSCGIAEIILSNLPSFIFLISPLNRVILCPSLFILTFSTAYLCAIGLTSTPVICAGVCLARTKGYGATPDPTTSIFSLVLICFAILSLSLPSLGE